MLFAALTPLLGHFEHELHLSSATAGLLVAAYAAGALVGGLPGGVAAARMGPRRAVLTGLALMAAASLGFAFSSSLAALSVDALPAGPRQRVHLGRRLLLADRRRSARAPRDA